MSIGSLGDIVFEVSSAKVLTIDEMKRKGSARWATHEVVGLKPIKEFLGPGLESISFNMQFSTALGITPEDELKKLRELRDKGTPVDFVLNGSPAGDNQWVVDDLGEAWKSFDGKGALVFATVDVSLTEYRKQEESS